MTMRELGRRALAAVPLERWPAGALVVDIHHQHWRVADWDRDPGTCWVRGEDGDEDLYPVDDSTHVLAIPGAWMDLSDPATLGCLLALVRAALDCDDAHTERVIPQPVGRGPVWLCWAHGVYSSALTEAEALVAALEGAP